MRKIKYFIATILWFVPDAIMLRIQYFVKLKRKLSLRNPKRFTEKLQWYKAYYRDPQMLRCTDKYLVRSFVIERLNDDKILNRLYQVCNNAKEIDFDNLPNSFVIKTSDGGNGDNIYVCTDKSKIDKAKIIKLVNSWRNKHYDKISREWAYRGAKSSRIIVERYLHDRNNQDGSIDDYKFLCYDGKFRFLWVDKDRYTKHKRGFWDQDLNFLAGVYSDHPTFENPPQLPANISDMIKIAEKLAHGFPFARVDLYNIEGKIYFGEITFYPCCGYVKYYPDSFDYELARYFNIQ